MAAPTSMDNLKDKLAEAMTLEKATLPVPQFDQITLDQLKAQIEQAIQQGQTFLKELAAKNKSKTVQIGHFTAKYSLSKLGDGYKGMAFQTLVCKINDGNWKICRYIGVEVIR